MNSEIKKAWRRRANFLNLRPLLGTFVSVPRELELNFHKHVLNSLTVEWKQLVQMFRRCITTPGRAKDPSSAVYMFGRERVPISRQVFQKFNMSPLLMKFMFGVRYNKFRDDKIRLRTKKSIFIHVASMERMISIFTVEGLVGVWFEMDLEEEPNLDVQSSDCRSCCGKVYMKKDGKDALGYIIGEHGSDWKILMDNNVVIVMERFQFDTELFCYKYSEHPWHLSRLYIYIYMYVFTYSVLYQ